MKCNNCGVSKTLYSVMDNKGDVADYCLTCLSEKRNIVLDITYGREKRVRQNVVQVPVTCNGVTVITRLEMKASSFVFLWSSRKISDKAKNQICCDMACSYWG